MISTVIESEFYRSLPLLFFIFIGHKMRKFEKLDFFCLSFKIGQSEVYLISPDTKKIALEKNFKEISFCSQVKWRWVFKIQLQWNF